MVKFGFSGTPMPACLHLRFGPLPFFIQFLKAGQRFDPWVDDCPLTYQSNYAPDKRDVLGSFLLSILSGHTRYAHIGSIANDTVNTQLLGMTKVVSDDSARRALQKMYEHQGIGWLQDHLHSCYGPLLTTRGYWDCRCHG